jgi:hypothetical protein
MATRRTVARLRASLGLVSAVGLMVAVTCAVVAAIVVYRDAIVTQGVRSTIEDAAATDRAIEVKLRAPASAVVDVADRLGAVELDEFQPAVVAVSSSYRVTEPSIDDPTISGSDGTTIITRAATFVGDDLWEVASGDLALLETTDVSTPVPAALHADAAALLGLDIGDLVRLDPSAPGPAEGLDLRVVAVIRPSDPGDPRWFGQPLGRAGSSSSGSFTEIGPFFLPAVDFARVAGDASYTARFAVDPDRVQPGDIDGIIRAVDAAPDTFGAALAPDRVRVETGLGDLLADTDTSVRSTTAVIAAVLLQVAAVALFGLAVAASALFASRRSERILLHSRGISNAQVARDALAEAAVIAAPAVIIGPLLAVGAVGLVGRWGPIGSAGLELRGAVSWAAFAASAVAAGIAVALIVWPAIAAARLPADEAGRPTGTPFLRRTGLDIVLVVLAVVGLWQLQRTGSVASAAEPGGRTSVDPVLVLAPTLGIAAASLLAVRMLGVAASGLERIGARSRRLAPALAGREAARSEGRRNRSSVLVVVAVAVASFALIQSVSWERSQRDQADAAVGADVVVVPDGRPDAGVAPAHLAAGYRALDGVTAVWPIGDRAVAVAAQPRPVPLVALDAGEFATYSRTRPDVVADADTIAALAAPVDLGGVELPPSGGEVTARVRLAASTPDPDGQPQPAPTEAEIAIVVADEFGTLRRLPGVEPVITTDGGAATAEVSFGRLDATGGEDRPARLVEIEVEVPIPFVDVRTFVTDVDGDGVDDTSPLDVPTVRTGIELLELDVDGAALDVGLATWTPLAPAPARFTISPPAASVDTVDAVDTVDTVDAQLALDLDAGTTAQRQASASFRFVTADAEAVAGFDDGSTVVDVLATPQLVEELAVGLDTPVSVRIGGTRLALRVVGETDVVPFAAGEPLAFLADHATLAAADYLASGARSDPDRWVVVLDESDRDEVTAVLGEAPFISAAVADRWEEAEQRIGDPILVGLTGSLLIAVGAVAIVAIVGLVMAAVTGARDRRGANAVLRALGASRRELRQWLVRETVPIGILAVTIGLAAGVVIASVVSSALTGDREGGDAVPPPQLVAPWPALAALVGVALVAIALVPLATSRLLHGVRPADELRIGDQR